MLSQQKYNLQHLYIIRGIVTLMLVCQFIGVVHAIEHDVHHDEHEICSVCILHYDQAKSLLDIDTRKQIELVFNERIQSEQSTLRFSAYKVLNNRSPPSLA